MCMLKLIHVLTVLFYYFFFSGNLVSEWTWTCPSTTGPSMSGFQMRLIPRLMKGHRLRKTQMTQEITHYAYIGFALIKGKTVPYLS